MKSLSQFKDRLAETREALIKSNQDNLAQAYLWVEEGIADLHKELAKGKELLREIEIAGDSAEIATDAGGNLTGKLYNKARAFAKAGY